MFRKFSFDHQHCQLAPNQILKSRKEKYYLAVVLSEVLETKTRPEKKEDKMREDWFDMTLLMGSTGHLRVATGAGADLRVFSAPSRTRRTGNFLGRRLRRQKRDVTKTIFANDGNLLTCLLFDRFMEVVREGVVIEVYTLYK